MEIPKISPWPKTEQEGLSLQHRLKELIITEGELDGAVLVAGVDTAFDHKNDMLFAGVSLYDIEDMTEYERASASAKAVFPYMPGLYTFREGPVILMALARLRNRPDAIIFSGHGVAHPRGIGLASHLGLILDIPSIGCARKKLAGQYEEPGKERGSVTSLILNNREVGKVYRSRERVKPIFISSGYRCRLESAVSMVVRCLGDYRLPEPLRSAHRLANRVKRNHRISF